MMSFQTTVINPLQGMLMEVGSFIPTLVSALVILIIGLVLAKLLRTLVSRLFKEVKFDKMADKIGMSGVLRKGGIKHTVSEPITSLVYGLLIILFVLITAKAVGLVFVSDLLDKILAYVPHVLTTAAVVVVGTIVAKVVSMFVHFVAGMMELPQPKLLERISRWAILIYTYTIAIEELGYGSIFVGTPYYILFAGIVFGLALAFGLGGRDAAARYLNRK